MFGPTDVLLAVRSFLFIFSEQASLVRLGYHGTFFYLCLANHSAVSKPNPTEGAEIYAGCGIPGCCKACCAMLTPLCGRRCAAYLCCSLFFCCRDFDFSNVHGTFSEINKMRTSTSIHPMYRIRPVLTLPRKSPSGERFAVLCTNAVQLSSPSWSMCGVNFSTTWHCL